VLINILFSTFLNAKEKSLVSIKTSSFQKVFEKDKSGKKIKKWIKVTKVVPGDIVKYVDTIVNDSNQTLKSVKVVNLIDKHLIYIDKSTSSKEKYKLKFSIDGGKSFKEANRLFINKKGKKTLAETKDYNALEFIVQEVPANSKVELSYKVKLK